MGYGNKSIKGFRKDNPEFDSNEEAYWSILGLYNDFIDELRLERLRRKLVKALEKQQRAEEQLRARQIQSLFNRFQLRPSISTFRSYWKYRLPDWVANQIEAPNNERLQNWVGKLPSGGVLELEVEHIIWWLHKISPYFDLLVSKSLLKLRNIKIYLTFLSGKHLIRKQMSILQFRKIQEG